MKIAVAVENGQVSSHFGHSSSFNFYEIEDGKVISSKSIQSPGKGHGILPEFIAENGASAVLAGGMGEGAVNACAAKKIETIIGVTGDPDDAASKYAKGELKSSESVCDHHHDEGHGSCHSHGDKGHGEKGGHEHGSCCHGK